MIYLNRYKNDANPSYQKIYELSGGQAQRVAIARMLMNCLKIKIILS